MTARNRSRSAGPLAALAASLLPLPAGAGETPGGARTDTASPGIAHVFFAPYGRLRRAVAQQDWKTGGAALGQIRRLIGINLGLGLATIAVVFFGRALALG